MTDPADDRLGPRRSDPSQASAARVYDYLLGGEYNYPVDQVAAANILREFPTVAKLAKYNRAWVQRAVRFLVRQGVYQFLDIASGIPTAGNVHEVAQEIAPTTRVVYVDIEKVAIDLGLEILENNPYATSIHADLRQPESVLEHPETRRLLDFDKPIAMVWGSVLHFVPNPDDPWAIFEKYKSALCSGSWIALSHVTDSLMTDAQRAELRAFLDKYNEYVADTLTSRPLADVERFLRGVELVEPGVVPMPDWKSDLPGYEPELGDITRATMVGAVGQLS